MDANTEARWLAVLCWLINGTGALKILWVPETISSPGYQVYRAQVALNGGVFDLFLRRSVEKTDLPAQLHLGLMRGRNRGEDGQASSLDCAVTDEGDVPKRLMRLWADVEDGAQTALEAFAARVEGRA
jgi:hypothetical protein